MEPFRLIKTLSTKLLLPMVLTDKVTYEQIFENCFVNAYVIDLSNNDFCFMDENLIIVRTDYTDEHYDETIYKDTCIDVYKNEYDEADIVFIYVHKILDKWVTDYYNIITGDYKNISEEYIDHLLHFWKLDKTSFLYYMLTVDKENIKKYIEEHDNIAKSPWKKFIQYHIDTYKGIPFNFNRESYNLTRNKEEESVDFSTLE